MAEVRAASVVVRAMTEADLEAVEQLERLCFSDAWSRNLLTQALSNSYDFMLVAEAEAETEGEAEVESGESVICGYANLRILAGEGEIERIAVHPEARRLGIGRKLMEAMEVLARENQADTVTLEVREGNQAARNLYESYGFCQEAVRRGYYRDPAEDAVIMWRRGI